LALDREGHAHPALHHAWLDDVALGPPREVEAAMRSFARDYFAYSRSFPSYLEMVISKLECPAHRELLARNLLEEGGRIDAEDAERLAAAGIDRADIDGVPHPELFRRFCHALGLETRELERSGGAGQAWRQGMLALLADASPAAAIGALGPGTEGVVRPIYQKLLRGIRRLDGLEPRDYVFFELHCSVDDQHSLDLRRVAHDLLDTPQAGREMRRGMLEALRLRQDFFSRQLR